MKQRLFYYFFIPKVLVSLWFWSINHVGYGGDSRVYLTFGHDIALVLSDKIELEENSIESNMSDEDFGNYSSIVTSMYTLSEGDLSGLRNNTIPIIVYHSLIYFLFCDSDLIYLLVQNMFCALVLTRIILTFNLRSTLLLLLLMFNPFSLYYGSTHMKEGLIEPLILGVYFELTKHKRNQWMLLFYLFLLAFFRFEFSLILILGLVASKYFNKVVLLFTLIIFMFALAYFGNLEMFRDWFVSLFLPLPGLYDLSYSWPSGVFLNAQGFYHLLIILYCIVAFFLKIDIRDLGFIFIITVVLSLNGQGMIGMKDRFVSSFVSLFLVLLFTRPRMGSRDFSG